MSEKNEAASQCSDVSGSTGDESGEVVLALERKSVPPFKTQDEYVYAMMEDLSKWLCTLYHVTINPDNFYDVIETGVLLCEHANAVQDFINKKQINQSRQSNPRSTPLSFAEDRVRYKSSAKPGTFLARDNISNFLSWCVRIGIPDDLRFETEDLVSRKHERNVILCMLEVARRGAKYGMLAPQIIQLEQEIDREIAGETPPTPPPEETKPSGPQPQIKTCDLMSLDEMVWDMVSRCSCPSQFPMIKVSEGKYQIGDSKTLIFVRILGNHVMVRIGRGWDTLENYLNCHDPCSCANKGHRPAQGGSPSPMQRKRRTSAPQTGLQQMQLDTKDVQREACIPDMTRYSNEPMPLLESDARGKWRITPQAQTLLNGIEQQVSVVAIVGKYRTGKSYLMNRLAGRNSGFRLGSTIQSETKGIWMWPTEHPEDPNRCLLLLDTEGLYDVKKGDKRHDVQLFTFALLLSGCLVFNTVGSIDNAFVQELQLVAELTKNINVKKATEEREDGTYFAAYFPALFVVLRDFFLKLEIEEKPVTTDEYLEHSLKSRKGLSSEDQAYNAPRECIRSYFPNRKCFALPKPVQDDDQLRDLDNPAVHITPNFLKKCQEAVNAILQAVKPINLTGNPIFGPGFLRLVEEYVRSVNEGGVPCIEAAINVLKEREYQRACDKAIQTYTEEMLKMIGGKFPISSAKLVALHNDTRRSAVDAFRKISTFEVTGTIYVEKLQKMIEDQYQEFLGKNNIVSSENSKQAIKTCFANLSQSNQAGKFAVKGGYEEFTKRKEEAIAKYNSIQDLGPMCDEELQKFLESIEDLEKAIIAADKALDEKAKQEAELRMILEKQEEREKLHLAEQEELRKQNERQRQENLKLVEAMQTGFENRQKQMQKEQGEAMKACEAEYRSMMEQGMKRQAEQQQMVLNGMKEDKRRQDEEIKNTRAEMKKNQQDMMNMIKQQQENDQKFKEQALEQQRLAQKERSRADKLNRAKFEEMQRKSDQQHKERLEAMRANSSSGNGLFGAIFGQIVQAAAKVIPALFNPKRSIKDAL